MLSASNITENIQVFYYAKIPVCHESWSETGLAPRSVLRTIHALDIHVSISSESPATVQHKFVINEMRGNWVNEGIQEAHPPIHAANNLFPLFFFTANDPLARRCCDRDCRDAAFSACVMPRRLHLELSGIGSAFGLSGVCEIVNWFCVNGACQSVCWRNRLVLSEPALLWSTSCAVWTKLLIIDLHLWELGLTTG